MIKSIEAIHRAKTGKVSDKWTSYLRFYDSLLREWVDKPLSILEIGVQNGGSLETWAEYFSNAVRIIGCDINERCAQLQFSDPRIQLVIGDAKLPHVFTAITQLQDRFDLIIDDGSHNSVDILANFLQYFPKLNPGGIYIVEDMHTLYYNNQGLGGGLLNEKTANQFFKKLVDVTNYQFWQDQVSLGAYFAAFIPEDHVPDFMKDGEIESVEFRNSIIVIRKSLEKGHSKLGERLVMAQEALITG